MEKTTTAGAPAGTGDVIDAIVGLQASDPLHATRHARKKVVDATQASYDLFFRPGDVRPGDVRPGHVRPGRVRPGDAGLPLAERLLVALHASLLSGSDALARHYRAALAEAGADPQALAAVEAGCEADLPATRLREMLLFTRKLILRPVEGDEAALRRLKDAGMATPDIVTLAQLVAFLSYQIRLAAGLAAMKAWGSQ